MDIALKVDTLGHHPTLPRPGCGGAGTGLLRRDSPGKGVPGEIPGEGRRADVDGLREALTEYEALQELIVKPQLYTHLLFSADSGDDLHKTLSQRGAEFGNLMARELLFFDLELMEIPDDKFAGLAGNARLASYRHFLEMIRKFRPTNGRVSTEYS